MANYYQIVQGSVDELKRMCPTLNFENYSFVSMGGEDVQFANSQVILAQDQPIVINNDQVQHVIYQQQPPPAANQITQSNQQQPKQYIIHEEDLQQESTFVAQSGPVRYKINLIPF